jgi:hypothetical protein
MTPNIADIIRQHVTLSVSCIDRLYLHAYMPKLQTSGGLCYFLHDHLGNPIPYCPTIPSRPTLVYVTTLYVAIRLSSVHEGGTNGRHTRRCPSHRSESKTRDGEPRCRINV